VTNIASTAFSVQDEMPTRFMTFLLSLRLGSGLRKLDYRQSDRKAGARIARRQPF
jgi:hypothetical protein